MLFAQIGHGGGFFCFSGATAAAFSGGFVVWGGEGAWAFVGRGFGQLVKAFEAGLAEVEADGAVRGLVDAVDAGGEDEFGGDDAHGLFFEVGGDFLDDGTVVEEALVADAHVGGEAGLGLFLEPSGAMLQEGVLARPVTPPAKLRSWAAVREPMRAVRLGAKSVMRDWT